MKRYLLVHYGEIGLKGANKDYFVKKLQERLGLQLQQAFRQNFVVQHVLGRLLIRLPADFDISVDEGKYAGVVGRIFGIRNFKFVYEGAVDIQKLADQIWKNMPKFDKRPETFCVRVKRSMKMPFCSVDAEREIGAILLKKGINLRAKMKHADLTVDVEFFNDRGYFSYKKHHGAGGLSGASQGKLVALISAGIDSPVAAYRMMRRGARVIFVHFHGYPYTDKDEMEQVKDLVKILSEYQAHTKLYLVPFAQVQKEIATNLDVPARIRTVLYRRAMLRIAEKIARKERAKGLVTGDSFGQVASQTPENIFAIHDASSIPVFQPLISFDKEGIIDMAREIGTLKISEQPCKDTCTMFMPEKPELKASVYDVRRFEEFLPLEDWIGEVLREAEVLGGSNFN